MQKNGSKKLLSFILCMALIVAMAFFTTGCGDNAGKDVSSGTGTESSMQTGNNAQVEGSAQTGDDAQVEENAQAEDNVLGTGNTEFTLTVVDKEGSETQFEIHTDKETVGDALTELDFIEGEESEYGLYVKTVNGITADYDTDGVYWAFYVNDEYASSGVDSTTITSGESYSFKVE
ncbi:MAG: DUF4430 domain-containing protein [Lachnospiraceae bacterium]|nr:DUF4430 domain-containing protein [Lachnospiraceae bacterium]